MWIRTSCDLEFHITVATPFVLMLRPRSGTHQWIAREEYKLVPHVPVSEFTDDYGNLCQRLVAPPGFELTKRIGPTGSGTSTRTAIAAAPEVIQL
jgi:hypothetical protein